MTALYRSCLATLILVVLCCGVYPLLVLGVGKVFLNHRAGGSLLTASDGRIIGSELIGQMFTQPKYFHPRPSAAGNGYDAANSSGSNLGPTNQKLRDAVQANVEVFLKENPTVPKGSVPVDAVTASGSGLDPHISPENARAQVDRVAKARGLDRAVVLGVVEAHTEGPQWWLFGEAGVNVLKLNLDLETLR